MSPKRTRAGKLTNLRPTVLRPSSARDMTRLTRRQRVDYPSGKGLQTRYELGDIRGQSPQMEQLRQTITLYARSRAAVLIQGETGTGKELAAQAIHQTFFHRQPHRQNKPSLPLSPSIAARLPSRCWKRNCLVMKRARLPVHDEEAGRGCLKSHTAARCFWMKSAKCPCRYKPDFCAYWRKKPSLASADTSRSRWMSG